MSSLPYTAIDSTYIKPVGKTGILLVEDEDTVREVTRRVLEHAGYAVTECSTPAEAICIARKSGNAFSLLLSDIVMPEMNGPDLARHLRELHPGLITVFMSGYADGYARSRLAVDQCSIYVQKPFTAQGLLAQIAAALRGPAPAKGRALSRVDA